MLNDEDRQVMMWFTCSTFVDIMIHRNIMEHSEYACIFRMLHDIFQVEFLASNVMNRALRCDTTLLMINLISSKEPVSVLTSLG